MSDRNKGILWTVAIVAVVAIGAAVYFMTQNPDVSDEDLTGAIGAAERHKAEQITDEDVVLGGPFAEPPAYAVFEVLSDEEKAEIVADVIAFGDLDPMGRIGLNRAELARMTEAQKSAELERPTITTPSPRERSVAQRST